MQSDDRYVHVAAAALFNERGQVLLALRPDHVHQGGLWEFPGGKIEPEEDVYTALGRELREELGIELKAARPLIQVPHEYQDRNVLLDIWRVQSFRGVPRGAEGQRLQWVDPEDLPRWPMPAADVPIVNAVRLPELYLITGSPEHDTDEFLARLERALQDGVRLVQLRAKTLEDAQYAELARTAVTLCRGYGARLLLNGPPELVEQLDADGIHLPSRRLLELQQRPLDARRWVAASCHNRDELVHAQRIGVDFAVLSPVQPTASHLNANPLGWEGFATAVCNVSIPVFALGGLKRSHLSEAFGNGAQGIAAIRSLWEPDQ
jgi:8-oxo-dGTP diphosphatase